MVTSVCGISGIILKHKISEDNRTKMRNEYLGKANNLACLKSVFLKYLLRERLSTL